MTRARAFTLLVAVLVIELGIGGVLAARRMNQTEPLVPDLSSVDPVSAAEFRTLAANCKTANDWVKLGEAYLATGFFTEAEACFRQAMILQPNTPEFAFKHGFALERIGRIEEANAAYDTAIQGRHTRLADIWYYVGRNHLRLEQAEPAADAFKRAGNLPGARFELALLYARAGRTEEADAEAAQLATEFSDAYPPVSLRYRLALARHDRQAANAFADQFTRRPLPLPTPFATETQWVFGLADGFGRDRLFRDAGREVQGGRFDVAEANLRQALDARWDPAIADRLAEVVFTQGRQEEAVRILTEAVDRGGPSFELLWRLGQAHDALGRHDQALALWERAARIATGPRARDLWHDLATWYDKAKQPEKAKPLFARAYLIDGTDALTAGRPDAAVKALERAVEADPRLAHAWFALGEAHRFAGRTGDARAAYNQCLKINPYHGRAIRSLELLGG